MLKKAELTLFDNNLHVYEYSKHEDSKAYLSRIAEDIANTNMNTNTYHHPLIYQSITGLQLNNAFKDLIESPEMKEFCIEKINAILPSTELTFAVTDMWLNIVPKHGQFNPHTHSGLFHGIYFLHVPENAGMMTFDSPAPFQYFENIGNPNINQFNSKRQTFSMNEGCIYIIPSHVTHGSTANLSEDNIVSFGFVMDLVER